MQFISYFALKSVFTVIVLSLTVKNTEAAKILFYIGGISTHSHRAGLEPLANKLAQRGHNVTFFSPLKSIESHPNVTNFCPDQLKAFNEKFQHSFGVIGMQSRIKKRYAADLVADYGMYMFDMGITICEDIFKSPEFQKWTKDSSFDLVVLDRSSVPDCMYALAYKFGAKTISYTPVSFILPWDSFTYGIPFESWWLPTVGVFYESAQMSLIDRFWNIYSGIRWFFNYDQYLLPKLDEISKKLLKMPNMPTIKEIIQKESLMLLNIHHSDQFVKSLPPFAVPVGGMHLKESTQKLPKEIEDFVQKGKEGFIYISFGSVVQVSTVPAEFLEIFMQAIRSLKNFRFLWKWEGKKPDNVPENALLLPWFPQQDVLAHPKIRTFIMQGGQCSVQQAIFNAVPIIVLPVNGDQDVNAKRISAAGNGITLEIFGLNSNMLVHAVNEVVQNKTFKVVASKLKDVSRDRPMHPVDTAVWWTEYVLRHGDTWFMKPTVKPWWMMLSFDVIGLYCFCLIGAFVLTVASIFLAFKAILLIRGLFQKSSKIKYQ